MKIEHIKRHKPCKEKIKSENKNEKTCNKEWKYNTETVIKGENKTHKINKTWQRRMKGRTKLENMQHKAWK